MDYWQEWYPTPIWANPNPSQKTSAFGNLLLNGRVSNVEGTCWWGQAGQCGAIFEQYWGAAEQGDSSSPPNVGECLQQIMLIPPNQRPPNTPQKNKKTKHWPKPVSGPLHVQTPLLSVTPLPLHVFAFEYSEHVGPSNAPHTMPWERVHSTPYYHHRGHCRHGIAWYGMVK